MPVGKTSLKQINSSGKSPENPPSIHIKSKSRVRDQGEVFTQEREVNAMLDLVKNETLRLESRFLEPACGTGNFLVPILERKLGLLDKPPKRSQKEYERDALIALASLYGVDLMLDNVEECRERLYKIFENRYMGKFKKKSRTDICKSAKAILTHNIRQGDALSLKDSEGEPIVFSEWTTPRPYKFQRKDYDFSELSPKEQKDLFDEVRLSDEGKPAFIPREIRKFPLTPMTKIGEL